MYQILFLLSSSQSYTAITSPWNPLVNCEIGSTDISLASGYYIDLILKINSSLSLNLDFLCTDYESMISTIENDPDTFAAGITSISYNTLEKIKFSTPTYDSGIILLTKKNSLSLFWLVFLPFDITLWLFLIFIILLNSHLIWMAEQHQQGPIHVKYSIGIIESIQHSLLSLFLIGDIKLRTLPGKSIQMVYWLMGMVLLGVYISNMSAILSINWLSSDIESYKDIMNEKVGIFEEFEGELKLHCSSVVKYKWSYDSSQKMIEDLKDGNIKAAAMPYPFALYLSKSNCDYLIVGQRFIVNYFALAFSNSFNNTIYRMITKLNLDLYVSNFHRNLENKFVLVTDTGTCDHTADIPIDINNFGGVWVVFLSQIFLGSGIWLFITLKLQNIVFKEEKDENKEIKNKLDLKQAAQTDLVSKFDKILRCSELKMKQKIKDYKEVLKVASVHHFEFKQILEDFSKNVK